MGELSTSHFRKLLSENVDYLQNFCKEWEPVYADSSVPEEAKDEIRTTIGLTNLLLRQKLKQFQGLIDDSEFKRGEKEITCLDLQGFWDMVYTEVEKLTKSFQKLLKSKENNWAPAQDQDHKVESKKVKTLPAVVKTVVTTKKHVSAARQRLAEAKQRMKEQMALKDGAISDSKTPMSNVTNIHDTLPVEEQKETSPSKKIKSRINIVEVKEKENLSLPLGTITPSSRKRSEKSNEIIPLQCLTRSAKKAMMAKQNALQKE